MNMKQLMKWLVLEQLLHLGFAAICPRGGDAVPQWITQLATHSVVLSAALDRCPYRQHHKGSRSIRTRNERPPGVTAVRLLLHSCYLQK